MVIQRIQTLWLLIALVLMVITGFQPFAWIGTQPYYLNDFPVLAVINWLVVALLFIDIFLFKNLRLQKTVSLVSLLLMVTLCVVGFIYQQRMLPEALPEWGGGVLLVSLAAIFDALAWRGMSRDHKKLSNSNRLWS